MNLEKIYYDNIFYYTDVIEDPQKVIDDLERINEDEKVHQSISMWKQDSCHRERKDLFFDKRDSSTGDNRLLAKEIIENMRSAIERVAKQFVTDRGLDIEPNISPSLDMCKYPPGGGLGVHHDTQDGDMNLLYSIVLYFNEDCEGGEISFMIDREGKSRPGTNLDDPNLDFWIKPKAGSALIFPSTHPYLHQSHPVKSGYKYISTAFIFVDGYDPFNPEHVQAYKKKDI